MPLAFANASASVSFPKTKSVYGSTFSRVSLKNYYKQEHILSEIREREGEEKVGLVYAEK